MDDIQKKKYLNSENGYKAKGYKRMKKFVTLYFIKVDFFVL